MHIFSGFSYFLKHTFHLSIVAKEAAIAASEAGE